MDSDRDRMGGTLGVMWAEWHSQESAEPRLSEPTAFMIHSTSAPSRMSAWSDLPEKCGSVIKGVAKKNSLTQNLNVSFLKNQMS